MSGVVVRRCGFDRRPAPFSGQLSPWPAFGTPGGAWSRSGTGSRPGWGEPRCRLDLRRNIRVYPRVGGGTSNVHEDLERKLGSIPAWAGEPSGNRYGECLQPVYPRVGGGTIMAEEDAFCVPGLSPRGRGNLDCANRPTLYRGSIPAWAGEPPDLTPRSSQFSSFSSCRWYTIPPPRWPTFSPPLTAPASTRLYWPECFSELAQGPTVSNSR